MNDNVLDITLAKKYPMLIEYDCGGQDIVTCVQDIPMACCFYVLQTNYVLEGRFIIGSIRTLQ